MNTIKSILLSPYKNLLHAFTTRTDGYSLLGNNLAYHVNDIKEDVDRNQHELAQHLGYPIERLVHMNQMHTDHIIIIDSLHKTDEIPVCDAVITQETNRPLMVMVADCIPALAYDPVQKVIAAIHAGRAGIFSNIISKTIAKMQKDFGSDPKDILVHLGPSIHECCYAVSEEIKEEAADLGYDYSVRTDSGKYFLDLLSIADQQLKSCGIRQEHIEVSRHCTACNTDTFFSYRAEKNSCGRFAGVIMLK